MRELFLAKSDSTTTSLVMETEEGEEFFLAVTDDLREILGAPKSEDDAWGKVSKLPFAAEADDSTDTADSVNSVASSDADSAASTASADENEQRDAEAKKDDNAASTAAESSDSTAPAAPQLTTTTPAPISQPRSGTRDNGDSRPRAISLRPAEIQARIRAGASAAEIAEEIGAPESRIEPFAHPVLLERARIADVAKQAHPIREDGPAKLTLWEILATAFAARGHSLSESNWDAYRHQGEPWILRITWKAGLSENEAEWTFKQSMSSPATVEARNSVAADLTDPDFVQPVRSLTSVGRGERYDKAIDGETPSAVTNITDFTAPTVVPEPQPADVEADSADADSGATGAARPAGAAETQASGSKASTATESASDKSKAESTDEEFLQNPSPEPKPKSRRRRATTPHWEDVLLGVRSNTKRPRE